MELRGEKTMAGWLYANSLSIVFVSLFVGFFVVHARFGSMKSNEDRTLRHLPPQSLGLYVRSADFWASVFQTWEAEFVAIGFYIVVSILLRQDGPSEAKPIGASNDATGETNE